ncbi:MAG TPA: hypothetical protein VNZ26_12410 [Vicinamibacterales bacterium]|nr:hypothetical protein [Vicinamibacterales bacterium]
MPTDEDKTAGSLAPQSADYVVATPRAAFGAVPLSLFVLLAMAACSSPTMPNTTHTSTMSAKIDGIPWNALRIIGGPSPPSPTFAFTGSDGVPNPNIQIAFVDIPAAPGTYPMGRPIPMTTPVIVGGGFLIFTPGEQLSSDNNGTITVATFSATGASGTFSFTAISIRSGVSKTVTEGVFDVTF